MLAGYRQGQIVLAEHQDVSDSDTASAFSIKRYSSAKSFFPDGTWSHDAITLAPLNPAFSPSKSPPTAPTPSASSPASSAFSDLFGVFSGRSPCRLADMPFHISWPRDNADGRASFSEAGDLDVDGNSLA